VAVGVAGYAPLIQTQIRLVREEREAFLNLRAPDVLLSVTLFAPQRGVFSAQRESGFRMIKFGFLELSCFRISSKVFLVTRNARAAGVFEMEPPFCVDLFLDFRVTRQAPGTADLRAALVALRAVRNAFKVLMRFRELAGRYLGVNASHTECEEQDEGGRYSHGLRQNIQ